MSSLSSVFTCQFSLNKEGLVDTHCGYGVGTYGTGYKWTAQKGTAMVSSGNFGLRSVHYVVSVWSYGVPGLSWYEIMDCEVPIN